MNDAELKSKEPPVTRKQLEELNRRVEAYYQNPEQGASWEEVKAKITSLSQRRREAKKR